jgi:hypothetical protein
MSGLPSISTEGTGGKKRGRIGLIFFRCIGFFPDLKQGDFIWVVRNKAL